MIVATWEVNLPIEKNRKIFEKILRLDPRGPILTKARMGRRINFLLSPDGGKEEKVLIHLPKDRFPEVDSVTLVAAYDAAISEFKRRGVLK